MRMDLARFTAGLFSRWSRRCSTSPEPSPAHLELGRLGEKLAARHLRKHGYKVLYRNFRAPRGGEVDLVCREDDVLVFVEVKTRRSEAFGAPSEAVTVEKQKLITRGALAWLRMLDNPEIYFRFDVVEVLVEERNARCTIIRNAFDLPEPYIY